MRNVKCSYCDEYRNEWCEKIIDSPHPDILRDCQYFHEAKSRWIPVTERLPENRVAVIVCYREWQPYTKRYLYDIVIGWYARKNSVNENVFCEWDDDCDYDEDDDEYYIKEGWYEFTTQGNSDRMNWFINAEVVAWQSLPELYKEEKK